MDEDRQLIEHLRRGDRAALRVIYERYKTPMMTVAVCLLGEPSAAEDILHDVFVTFAGRAGLSVHRNLKSYLTTCVANRARDYLRGRARENRLCAETLEDVNVVAQDPDPVNRVIEGENNREVLKALAQLPYEQREAITLHLKGQMTIDEIARLRGLSPNTVKSRYQYGLDKVRSILREGVGT